MKSVPFENAIKERKARFVHFRWLLFFWLGALSYLSVQAHAAAQAPAYGLLCVFIASQFALQTLPLKYFDGLNMLNALFLLDVNFIVAGFGVSGQLHPEIMVALFVGIFMAALSRSMAQSLATTAVVIGLYLAFRSQENVGVDFSQPLQLLQIPFLFISSLHSTMLAQEAENELQARHLLVADKSRLSRHMNSTMSEIAHYCKDMSALVDALPFGAIMLDPEKRLRVCNDIAEDVLGIDSVPLIGASLDVHPDLAQLLPYLERISNEPLLDFIELNLPSREGGSWSLNLGVYPVLEGEMERGLLLVLIPSGNSEKLKNALPKPHIVPDFDPRAMLNLPPLRPMAAASMAPLPDAVNLVGSRA